MRQTSLLAFTDLKPYLGQRHEQILEALAVIEPATAYEIARYMHYSDPNAVRPRLHELFERGAVRSHSTRECRITGKKAIEWVIA